MLERRTDHGLLNRHREAVRPEWIDYNGHMNVAYYLLTFDHATDVFFEEIGLDADYRARTGGSSFAIETHITYQREVAEGDHLRFTTQLIDYDKKRMHYFHRMYHEAEDYLAATCECLSLHIDLNQRRVVEFPTEIADRLAAFAEIQQGLPIPEEVGRSIRLASKKTGQRGALAETGA